jgi:perosamine synthetase
MEALGALARRHGLRVVEDAAHALPAKYQEKMIGTIGDITCFSFYATKTMTTGEGGMATTSNPEWADRMRVMSLHGISKDAWNRYTSEGSWYYEVHAPGYKYNLTDIAAAIGIEQLKKCEKFLQDRKRIADVYDAGFADLAEIRVPVRRSGLQHAWPLYIIQLVLERLRINRSQFIEALKEAGIGASVHFIPLHLHPFYRDTFRYKPEDFPNASRVFTQIVSLPIFPKMTVADTSHVIETVRKIVEQYRK